MKVVMVLGASGAALLGVVVGASDPTASAQYIELSEEAAALTDSAGPRRRRLLLLRRDLPRRTRLRVVVGGWLVRVSAAWP